VGGSIGGTVNASGLFTAGVATGACTVKAEVTIPAALSGTAAVTVGTTPAPTPTPTPEKHDKTNLFGLIKGYLKNIGSDNFLVGEWQVKNGTGTDTIKMIPGVVQSLTGPTLVILPNGKTTNSSFTLTTTTVTLPEGTVLKAGDKVMVITVNDVVTTVVKIIAPTTSGKPPGLEKKDEDKREGKDTPRGWSEGNKTGWGKDHGNKSQGNED
jgi:hypothetical protein